MAVLKYPAAFQMLDGGMGFWYWGGRITLFKDRIVLSLVGIKRIEMYYREILKIEEDVSCLRRCIIINCVEHRVRIVVSSRHREEVFDELKGRMRAIWEE